MVQWAYNPTNIFGACMSVNLRGLGGGVAWEQEQVQEQVQVQVQV